MEQVYNPDGGMNIVNLTQDHLGLIDVGIIGGYGISSGLEIIQGVRIETPYGLPSHPLILGRIGSTRVAFLPRHGRHHEIPSHAVNYRANMYALHRIGVRKVISAIAAGSLVQGIDPGHIAIPSDYIDMTKRRCDTFHDSAPVHHFSPSEPFCRELRSLGEKLATDIGFSVHGDTVSIIIEGPRFATIAESRHYQSMGAHIINMSLYPEVMLARELGMCYSSIALITDYDAGHMGSMHCKAVTLKEIDRVQACYKVRCTELVCRSVEMASRAVCTYCSSHIEDARKHGPQSYLEEEEDVSPPK